MKLFTTLRCKKTRKNFNHHSGVKKREKGKGNQGKETGPRWNSAFGGRGKSGVLILRRGRDQIDRQEGGKQKCLAKEGGWVGAIRWPYFHALSYSRRGKKDSKKRLVCRKSREGERMCGVSVPGQ